MYSIQDYQSLPQDPGIYKLIDIESGKFYFGSSINVRRRIWQHVYRFKRGDHSNPIMQAIWNKNPKRFMCQVLNVLKGADKQMLLFAEQAVLDAYGVGTNPSCMNVLVKANSHLGVKRRPESIEKLRRVHIGRKTSEETKAKQRAAKLGKPLSEEHKKKIGDAARGKKINRPKGIMMYGRRKLSNEQVVELRKLKQSGMSYSALKQKYGLGVGTIQKIVNRQSYSDVA